MRHPQAHNEALSLVEAHDGRAKKMVENKLDDRLARGKVEDALHLDQVRREIDRVYELTGED